MASEVFYDLMVQCIMKSLTNVSVDTLFLGPEGALEILFYLQIQFVQSVFCYLQKSLAKHNHILASPTRLALRRHN